MHYICLLAIHTTSHVHSVWISELRGGKLRWQSVRQDLIGQHLGHKLTDYSLVINFHVAAFLPSRIQPTIITIVMRLACRPLPAHSGSQVAITSSNCVIHVFAVCVLHCFNFNVIM